MMRLIASKLDIRLTDNPIVSRKLLQLRVVTRGPKAFSKVGNVA